MSFLYQKDLGVETMTLEPISFARHFEVPPDYRDFFLEIVRGVESSRAQIDLEIENVAEHWKLYRMEKIDLAILRIATWELMEAQKTPYKVILDEAVEIAKKFSTNESASFVNGLLDRLAKKLRSENEAAEDESGKDLVPIGNSQ